MKKIIILFIVLLALPVWSQNLNNGNKIGVYKHYDTTRVEDTLKVNRRRVKTDLEENGFTKYFWGDECKFALNFTDYMSVNINKRNVINKNNIDGYSLGNNMYSFDMWMTDYGAFEFGANFKKKPPNGLHEVVFDIQTEGLDFFYQPELTQQEIDDGDYRPDSVIGSYAVYHKTGKHNYNERDGGDNLTGNYNYYYTGKAFHIYRPKAWDDAGDTVWGYMDIDTISNTMTLGVDSIWLVNADYPVTVDPVFGYKVDGSSSKDMGNFIRGSKFNVGGSNITADSITIRAESGIGGLCSYTDNAGSPDAFVDSSDAPIVSQGYLTFGSDAWYGFESALGVTYSASTDYWLCGLKFENNSITVSHDTGESNTEFWANVGSTDLWPPDASIASSTLGTRKYSIYVTEIGEEPEPSDSSRRRKILLGGLYEEDNYNFVCVAHSDWR